MCINVRAAYTTHAARERYPQPQTTARTLHVRALSGSTIPTPPVKRALHRPRAEAAVPRGVRPASTTSTTASSSPTFRVELKPPGRCPTRQRQRRVVSTTRTQTRQGHMPPTSTPPHARTPTSTPTPVHLPPSTIRPRSARARIPTTPSRCTHEGRGLQSPVLVPAPSAHQITPAPAPSAAHPAPPHRPHAHPLSAQMRHLPRIVSAPRLRSPASCAHPAPPRGTPIHNASSRATPRDTRQSARSRTQDPDGRARTATDALETASEELHRAVCCGDVQRKPVCPMPVGAEGNGKGEERGRNREGGNGEPRQNGPRDDGARTRGIGEWDAGLDNEERGTERRVRGEGMRDGGGWGLDIEEGESEGEEEWDEGAGGRKRRSEGRARTGKNGRGWRAGGEKTGGGCRERRRVRRGAGAAGKETGLEWEEGRDERTRGDGKSGTADEDGRGDKEATRMERKKGEEVIQAGDGGVVRQHETWGRRRGRCAEGVVAME
ncbi:hypothetical protein DFH09DRAFT_1103488 [Mycena vulgaris]|nr:hypothetical protein DFH09DRAFT_1103488 [Mycena vulgaris]